MFWHVKRQYDGIDTNTELNVVHPHHILELITWFQDVFLNKTGEVWYL